MPDAPLIVLAILITLGSGAALLLGIASHLYRRLSVRSNAEEWPDDG